MQTEMHKKIVVGLLFSESSKCVSEILLILLFVLVALVSICRGIPESKVQPLIAAKTDTITSTVPVIPNNTNLTEATVVSNNQSQSTGSTNLLNVSDLITGKLEAKIANTTTTYIYYSETTTGPSLSGGAIAGIVIGVIILLYCCGAVGGAKSGHWEKVLVWVRH